MYLPYSDRYYRSDKEQWGGWWVNHQGAGDQWYDRFYRSGSDYIHRQTGKPFIVEFGEMQGCAVADNHAAMVRELEARGNRSYDIEDHRVCAASRPIPRSSGVACCRYGHATSSGGWSTIQANARP